MPLSLDLSTTLTNPVDQNRSYALAITTGSDTLTITVNSNFPRVLALVSDVAFTLRSSTSGAAFPVAAATPINIQVCTTTIFNIIGASSGTLSTLILK